MSWMHLGRSASILSRVCLLLVLFLAPYTLDVGAPFGTASSNGAGDDDDDDGGDSAAFSNGSSDSYVSFGPQKMLEYLRGKTTMSSSCHDMYWCVSTLGFFVPRAPQIEARIAQGIWNPITYYATCEAKHHKKKDIIPVIVDIGVNDGSDISIWAQVFLQQRMPIGVQPAHLFLFEPLETFSAIIKKKVKSLKSVRNRIHFYEAAVGRKHNREVKFIGDHVVARIVSKNDDPKAALAANQTVRVVKQVSLIDSIRETLPKEQNNNFWIPFLKIDCEGHDPNILLNSQILFKQQRVEVIVFELNQFTQEAVDLSTKYRVAMKMLKSYGYRLYLHAIDPHLKLSSNTQQFVLVEITEFTSWPIYLEIMVAIKGSSVSTLLPEVTQRTDSYVLHSYFRSIARSRVLKTTWSKKLYDETSLQLADEYRRVAGLCTIHPNRTSQCIRSVHVLSCKHCDWVRSWRYAKSWEVDVLGWRLKIRF